MQPKYRMKNADGQWIEVDPANLQLPPIRRESLDGVLIKRIGRVHFALRDVLQEDGRPMSLEHFEVGFMRGEDPVKEVALWEVVVSALEKSRGFYPPELYVRKKLYDRLILILAGVLSDEQFRDEDSAVIRKCLTSALSEKGTVADGKMVICHLCCKRICAADPRFCPRCGGVMGTASTIGLKR